MNKEALANDLEIAIGFNDIKQFREVWTIPARDVLIDDLPILHYAIQELADNIVKYLLDDGYYDINSQAPDGSTPIVLAMNEFNETAEEIVEMIFKYYPNVNVDIPDSNGRNALLAGMMSGISGRYTMMVAEKTTNLEQLDTEMNETVVKACLRNKDMYRMHAQILRIFIEKGAVIDKDDIKKMMLFTARRGISVVWKAIDARPELSEMVLQVAAANGFDEFMPQAAQDLFLF